MKKLLLGALALGLQSCVSVPPVNNYFGEGNYAAVVREIEKNHNALETTPLGQLYFLCPAYYEIKEYDKFTACADYILQHPDPGAEFYPGVDITYINKTEFKGMMRSYKARMYLEFGEYQKALDTARLAYTQLSDSTPHENRLLINKMPPLEVQAFALIQLGKPEQVKPIISELASLDTFSAGRSQIAKLRQTALAKIYFALHDYSNARKVLEQDVADPLYWLVSPLMLMVDNVNLDEEVREGALFVPKFYMLTKSYLETGAMTQGIEGLDKLLANPIIPSFGEIYWSALKDRATLYWQEGDKQQAIALLKQAVEVIESQRASIQSEAYKIGFVGDKQKVYQQLIDYLADDNQITQAFSYVEKAKARALVDMLAQKTRFSATGNTTEDTLASLSKLEQQLQVETVESIKQSSKTRGLILQKRQQIEQSAPELASLVSVTNVNVSALQQQLQGDEQLLEFYIDDSYLYAFVADTNTISLTRTPIGTLTQTIAHFRQAILEPNNNAWQALSESLYHQIFAPVASKVNRSKLVIVPHGALHYLPFAALYDGRQFVLDNYSLRFLPSASVMQFLKSPQHRAGVPMLALGNPDLGDSQFDLPGTQQEVGSISRVVPGSVVALRQQATESLLKEYADQVPVLHIASHGEFNPKAPLQSRLLLVGDAKNDGNLTVSELYDMKINADLVTLSACQTGLGDIQSGDDVIGLTRGFMFAGAANIIASLWVVDDEATARLMTDLYNNLRHEDKQQSLRDAQRDVRQHYPHPYYWAAFQLTGTGT